MPDRLLKLAFAGARVRGELVQLGDAWCERRRIVGTRLR